MRSLPERYATGADRPDRNLAHTLEQALEPRRILNEIMYYRLLN